MDLGGMGSHGSSRRVAGPSSQSCSTTRCSDAFVLGIAASVVCAACPHEVTRRREWSDVRFNLLTALVHSVAAALLLTVAPSLGLAQEEGSAVLRGGVTLSPQVSGALQGDVRVWRTLSVVGSVRGVRTGWGCIGIESRSPCTPDGISLGLGVRLTKEMSHSWSVFAEVGGGGHAYSADSWYPQLEGSAGVEWPLGSRGVLEVGAYVSRIGASRFSTLQENYGSVPGEAHHVVGGLTAMLGVRIR